jgi:hypothetical protein
VGGAVLVVATRIALWLGVQLLVTGLLVLAGAAATGGQALDEAAGWWMVYGALVDLAPWASSAGYCGTRAAAIVACWGRRPPSGRWR